MVIGRGHIEVEHSKHLSAERGRGEDKSAGARRWVFDAGHDSGTALASAAHSIPVQPARQSRFRERLRIFFLLTRFVSIPIFLTMEKRIAILVRIEQAKAEELRRIAKEERRPVGNLAEKIIADWLTARVS